MRKCYRCGSEVLEEYGLKISSLMAWVALVLLFKGQEIMTKEFGKVKATVCPKSGEISLYTDNYKILEEK